MNTMDLDNIINRLVSEIPKISEKVGDNWYPCGFAWLHIEGRHPFIRWMKKNGKREFHNTWIYKDRIVITKAYHSGYNIYFRYHGRTATEQQSLNFKEPLYKLFQKELEKIGVKAYLRTRLD